MHMAVEKTSFKIDEGIELNMKILMISPVCPFPTDTGDRVRINSIFTELSKYHEVALIFPGSNNRLGETIVNDPKYSIFTTKGQNYKYSQKIKSLFHKYPYHYVLWYSAEMQESINELLLINNYDMILCNYLYTVPYVKNSNIPIVVDLQNIDHIYWNRKTNYYRDNKEYLKSIISRRNLAKIKIFEREMFNRVDGIITVSSQDAKEIKKSINNDSKIIITTPNGVDTETYRLKSSLKPSEDLIIGFLGSLNLDLNIDAAFTLCKEILPKVQQRLKKKNVSALLVGKNPPKSLIKYAENHSERKINLTGTVTNVSEYIKQIDILVLPLKSGSGTKLRVFEALSCGVNIVGSRMAFDGIEGLIANIHIMIADNPDEFVEKICFLANDVNKQKEMTLKGRELIESIYSWESICRELSDSLTKNFSA